MDKPQNDYGLFLKKALEDAVTAHSKSIECCGAKLIELSDWVCETFEKQGKVLLFGNGGSAADSQHIAAEFVNRFRLERRPLPAIALTTDTSVLTSIANDYHYDEIFSKQVQALARPEDVVVGISTSGNSLNVNKGLAAARRTGAHTVAFTGGAQGSVEEYADMVIRSETRDTPRIQEVHIFLGHLLCDLVEQKLFT